VRCPVFIPDYGVAVTEASDPRTFDGIAHDVRARGGMSLLQKIDSEPEESYDVAAAHTRNMRCPTWLGLSRDIRVFQTGFGGPGEAWHWVQPRFHGRVVTLRETGDGPVRYDFMLGRGAGCIEDITRRLEEDTLPILHGTVTDGDVAYRFTAFVTPERRKFTARALRGTDYRVANRYSSGIMLTDAEQEEIDALEPEELSRNEETVFRFRVEAVNTSDASRYAWFLNPRPNGGKATSVLDGSTGLAAFADGDVFCASELNAQPMPEQEVAVLLPPAGRATFAFVIPHRPVSGARARKLAAQDFDAKHAECRRFWKHRLAEAATLRVPEKRIDDMVRAGVLHLDLVTYGREPDGPLAATVGVYSPIGSESSPIIQFTDAVGRHDVARRTLEYFLERQHDDGLMITFGGYRLETGAVLWSIGEHWRMTRDDAWAKRIAPGLVKACDYIIAWRKRNMRPDLRGRGYGMVEGKVADPEDPYHSFMLNGFMHLGMKRAAEMLAGVDAAASKRIAREAVGLRRDIRRAFDGMLAKSPVVPLGDGTWVPTCGPWAEARGPVCLYADGGNWYTHAAFTTRDSLIGPLYLILQEVVDPDEPGADFMMRYHTELMHLRNVAFTQPFYSRHPHAHLLRGEVKAFLKTYYNGFSGLADRETGTFWEHYTHVSPHKTHEEGWFLMQTRWMLWMEEDDTLRLLAGIPRKWMENGERIELENVASYFGRLDLRVASHVSKGRIEATVKVDSDRLPKRVTLRLPHPDGKRATHAIGGVYDPDTETVRIDAFAGAAKIVLAFR
ncbi:MAG TPA: hypothetical protein VMX57_04935, partial [Planctomycetota bacterium]|nr:hypothetical protein [Planctomycetota bacterium]